MTNSLLVPNLVRKSKRALLSAKVTLQIGDPNSAVDRSYFAMFHITKAALLSVGVSEDRLPRTHAGVIATFWQRAIESGKIDAGLAESLNRAEALRMEAEAAYTQTEIDPKSAAAAVAQAETFVNTVERVFSLEESIHHSSAEDHKHGDNDKVSDAQV